MHHQKLLNNEIAQVKSNILAMLAKSTYPVHKNLMLVLNKTASNEWLDCAAEKLGPEYALLISRMTKLEAAVSQIEIGQYGYCCDCEEKINSESLLIDPAIQRCHSCAKK